MRRHVLSFLAPVAVFAAAAFGHFPFIVPDKGGSTARLVMSETLEPDPDVSIGILGGATLSVRGADGRDTPLTLVKGEHWMVMELPGAEAPGGTRVIHGVADLGVMTRGKPHVLIYHPKTIIGDAFDSKTQLGAAVPIELVPVRVEGGFSLKLLIAGSPAANAEMLVILPGGEEFECVTDDAGLSPVFAEAGRYGAWARHWADEPGDRAGKAYEQVRRYATLVMDYAEQPLAAPAGAPAVGGLVRGVTFRAALPRAIASFGAVESGGWLYVYGGHSAVRHSYSTASVSGRFHRLNLNGEGGAWEELPGGVAVQGLNLAAHAGKVYRAGGMEPRNAPGEPSDSHSITDAARFDPASGSWEPLPPLPSPRSSHDLVVIGDTLMVVGGWWMRGKDEEPWWPETIDTLDVLPGGASMAARSWGSIPQPFARRALIAAVLGDRVFVMGGFDADEEPSLDVDAYDTKSGEWTRGPDIPGLRRNGFAPAACAHGGSLYLSVGTGEMFRLSADGAAWEPFATTTPRIVHRMVAWRDEILVAGGAAEATMLDLVEAVAVSSPGAPGDR